jgi:very-short-patch-repair endonuclease/DNA polymerase III delta prime subunit
MSDTPTPATPTDDARIGAALDAWKRKLLDLTKRNRALNFRMTAASTVAVRDEQPAEVFRRLYLAEKSMRFQAAQPPAPPAAAAAPIRAPAPSVTADTSSTAGNPVTPQANPAPVAPADASTDATESGSADVASAEASAVVADPASAGTAPAPVSTEAAGSASTEARSAPAGGSAWTEGESASANAGGSASTEAGVAAADGGGSASNETGVASADVGGSASVGAGSAAADAGGSVSTEGVAAPVSAEGGAADGIAGIGGTASTEVAVSPSVAEDGAQVGFDDLEDEDGPASAFAPYEVASLAEKHRDDVLQTTSLPDKLDLQLRRIDEQARETREEQGVNALFLALGMLHYTEAKESEQVFRAPLVLLPVALARTSAGAGYTLSATDDDYIVNPALAEYLKRGPGITLPELPDPASIPDDYDLQQFLAAVTEAVKAQAGWQVTTEIYLGLFAFQKFAMYKDLDGNGAAFGSHRLVRQLVTRSGGQLAALPDDVRDMDLDDAFPPEATAQVVDADSSQLRAIAAVDRGHDLVLEGPPGTGKSQTITNLIAQALHGGQSVLFVAEKMAALSVVHERLVRAGLGDFCLELHSSKANKRAVVKEIARSLDASLQRPKPGEPVAGRLPGVRHTLTDYAQAVHAPYDAAGFTPYRGFGELMALREAPRVKLEAGIANVTREQFEDAVRGLEDLARAAAETGDVRGHPWRGSGRTLWSEDDLDVAGDLVRDLRGRLAETARHAEAVQAAFNLPPLRTFADVDTAVRVAAVLARSPGAPLGVLTSDAWTAPPPQALELIARGRVVSDLDRRIGHWFTGDVFQQEHTADAQFIEEKESSPFGFLNFLSGRHRAVKRRWMGYRQPSYTGSLLEQAAEMRKADELRRERDALTAADATGRELFGGLWQGERSDWDALDGYVRWVVEFRGLCVQHRLADETAALGSHPAPDVSLIETLRTSSEGAARALDGLRALAQWPDTFLADAPLAEIADRAAALEAGLPLAPRWAAFELVRARAAAGLAGELLAPAFAGELAWDDLPRAFRRAFHQKWVSAAVQEREPLRQFATLSHEQRVAEFRTLDQAVLAENRDALVVRLRDAVQARLREPAAKEAMPFLQTQMARERRHAPLRRTLQQSGAAIRAIKPCFMMSPLTVAQLLDGGNPSFDLVIFDEASQLPSEDAVGAIVRGRRLIVVGDPKQLPPTNFFSVMSGQSSSAELADDGTPLVEDSESVLEEFMGAGVPRTRLRWHYRSTHESLITFSNVSFYEADLHTFPSVETASHAAGLAFEHVADGVYEGKGLNIVEARRVVDAVVRHAKEHPEVSLGVGTFNLRQQLAIQDELELRRRQDPSLEPFFSRERAEPFFVKNLENIQGDERDVIFLSVTYAKARDGRLRYNFGPINGENGWRRLNVLTTRARRRMVVFSSMKGDEINPASATSRGPALLREFLLFAERGQLDSATATVAADAESLFEQQVMEELIRRGVQVQPQVGAAGYRIDMAVVDPDAPGRFICGIECDGVSYHASETARDRDRLRQQVLEARGWHIHRLWSTDWFKDREGQIERLMRLIEVSRVQGRQDAAAREAAEEQRLRDEADREQQRIAQVASASAPEAVDSAAPAQPPAPAPPSAEEIPAPQSVPYRMADTASTFAGTDILAAPQSLLLNALRVVVDAEAPLHLDDATARVAAMWGLTRTGSRMESRIVQAVEAAQAQGILARRGDFLYAPGGPVAVRSRREVRIPAERIAPEEYREAAVQVLRAAPGGLPRKELTAQVRSMLGFSRTGARLEEAIGAALEALLADGTCGEASTGIRLRQSDASAGETPP